MTYPLILIKRVFLKSVLKISIILIEQDCPEAVVHGQAHGQLQLEEVDMTLRPVILVTNILSAICFVLVKFIYSEKATKFCEISTNYLTGST